MSETVISAKNLSKCYRLGIRENPRETLVGSAIDFIKSPLANYNRLRRLTQFDDEDSDDILWALRDVSFELKRGEVVGFIGRNGAGKSTLLKILSRIAEPTRGGVDIYGRLSSLLEVGTGFHPELTGRENVYLNGTILGMKRKEIDRKFDEIVAFSGVEKFLETPVKRYSSGMAVRLAFAVAAHLDPEILVIDEVLAVGDAHFQQKSIGKMQEVSRGEGRTVLFVSHNMAAVEMLCTRVIVMDKGRMIFDGDPKPAIQAYLKANMIRPAGELVSVRRQGDGQFRFTTFFMTDPAGQNTEVVQGGGSIVFHVRYEAPNPQALQSVDVSFEIYTATGDRLAIVWASDEGTNLEELGVEGTISCRFDNLPLKPGRYQIRVSGHCGYTLADEPVDPVGILEVEVGDYYRNGRTPRDTTNAPFLMRTAWSVTPQQTNDLNLPQSLAL
ncbi:ABC transporter ATP-binding protein [Opitutales bacterium ASA1]|uniref:ABC transporter ATP-binding protein n=1 Tax=Congregicoccus parvus TaxID=3081749 RepID=UPI002B2BC179|nr:ABC transporter ATP-binding protein [Opitutales bacterium ASA1]